MEKILTKEIIAPILIVLIGLIIYNVVKKMLDKAFEIRAKRYKNNRYKTLASLIRNVVKYLMIVICAVMVLDVFGIDTKSIITSLGVVGVVTGLAMQDFLKDFVAGITIVLENQYAIGDLVTIGGFKGTVNAFTLKTTRIKAWTGEEKIIANHLVTDVINHTHHDSLAILDVNVAYESNIEKVNKILDTLCTKMADELENLKGEVTLLGIEDLGDSAITFRITAVTKSGEQYAVQRKMRKLVKEELDKEKISIPYNQLVVHNG